VHHEDMPYPENRVVIDDNKVDGVLIKHTIKKELRDPKTTVSSIPTKCWYEIDESERPIPAHRSR
jgi:hypothetical protein